MAAIAFGVPVSARSCGSVEEAATSVAPASSSMTWAEMCLLERETATRGRAAVPAILNRTRACRRIRSSLEDRAITSVPFLPCA